eukprot:10007732-Ditylum_brightwellii.AAC.1
MENRPIPPSIAGTTLCNVPSSVFHLFLDVRHFGSGILSRSLIILLKHEKVYVLKLWVGLHCLGSLLRALVGCWQWHQGSFHANLSR